MKDAAAKRLTVFQRDGFRCRWCGSRENLTLDHIVPRSQGGANANTNLQTLCHDCNRLKGSLLLTQEETPSGTLHDFVAGALLLQIRHHGLITSKHVNLAAARLAKALRLADAREKAVPEKVEEMQAYVARLEAMLKGLRESVRKMSRAKRHQTRRARAAESLLRYALKLVANGGGVHSGWVAQAEAHLERIKTWDEFNPERWVPERQEVGS